MNRQPALGDKPQYPSPSIVGGNPFKGATIFWTFIKHVRRN